MADEILKRDENHEPVIGLVTDDSNQFIKMGRMDDASKGLKVIIVGGSGAGTVTSITASTGLTATPNPIVGVGTMALATSLQPMATLAGNSLKVLRVNVGETALEYSSAGSGTVSNVSVTTANGISGSVATSTTTPAITLTLGAITPTSIAGTSFTGNNTYSGANAFSSLPTSSATPTTGNELVNKNYVDGFVQGLTVKASCNVATTANITLSGEQTIDGVLTSASRVLVKNQSTGANNGIYVSGGGAWTRATDYDQSSEIGAGTFCAILAGSTQANTLWAQTVVNPTINITALVFTQLTTAGTGTVTSVSVVSANGVSGSVATATTTPAITLTLGAITPSAISGTRITKRVITTTQSATPTINTDNTDVAYITGLAQAITSFTSNLSGTPVNGDVLILDITDNGTGRALTFGASFEASGTVALPTTTVASTKLTIGFRWNIATSKWTCVAAV